MSFDLNQYKISCTIFSSTLSLFYCDY